MTKIEKVAVKELQSKLLQIKNTGKAHINLVQYKKNGLVVVKGIYKTIAGKKVKVGSKLFLTEKAKMFLNVAV